MRLFPTCPLVLLIVCNLSPVDLRAQSGSGAGSGESTRVRIERAVARQQDSVRNMTDSVSAQQRVVARQRLASRTADFNAPSSATCESLPPREISALVDTAARQTSVAPELIRSVMRQESGFRSCAVSPKGAIGLMQLEPATAADLGVKDLFDPEANVLGGSRLLKLLMERYGGDIALTLGAYNAGAARVDAAGGVPKIPETVDYVSRILGMLSTVSSTDGGKTQSGDLSDQLGPVNAPATSFWLSDSDGGR
jgi:soluble lytic murein transglycosylase-like protein